MSTKYLFAAMTARTDDPTAKLILIYLADAANENGFCWPAHSTIANGCECSIATVKRKIDDLIVKGYIDYESRSVKGFKTSNKYMMISPDDIRINGRSKDEQQVMVDNGKIAQPAIAQPELTVSSHRAIEPISNLVTTTTTKKPSVGDVTEYVETRDIKINPEAFIDYYSANGWKVGRSSMKDWKAAVRTWERNEKKPKAGRAVVTTKQSSIADDLSDTSWAY